MSGWRLKSSIRGWTEDQQANTNRQFELLGTGVTRICINEVLQPLNSIVV